MNDKYVNFEIENSVYGHTSEAETLEWKCGLDYSRFTNAPEPEIIRAETREEALKQYLLKHGSTNAALVVVELKEDDNGG
jgi:hypothetical protein